MGGASEHFERPRIIPLRMLIHHEHWCVIADAAACRALPIRSAGTYCWHHLRLIRLHRYVQNVSSEQQQLTPSTLPL